jgi:hypothetical protein
MSPEKFKPEIIVQHLVGFENIGERNVLYHLSIVIIGIKSLHGDTVTPEYFFK